MEHYNLRQVPGRKPRSSQKGKQVSSESDARRIDQTKVSASQVQSRAQNCQDIHEASETPVRYPSLHTDIKQSDEYFIQDGFIYLNLFRPNLASLHQMYALEG